MFPGRGFSDCERIPAILKTSHSSQGHGQTNDEESAHGLGHLQDPYNKAEPAAGIPKPAVSPGKLGVRLWQHDLWWQIISAALSGEPNQVDLEFHPGLAQPAVSRYAATTPKLLRWFNGFNLNLPYAQKVKPFSFLLSLFGNSFANVPSSVNALIAEGAPATRRSFRQARPAAPFDTNLKKAIEKAFDRETGEAVPPEALKSYRQVLAQYHLHPESKFFNGDFLDTGHTVRRRVSVAGVRNIGKEADKLDERFHLGLNEDAAVEYGISLEGRDRLLTEMQKAVEVQGRRHRSTACHTIVSPLMVLQRGSVVTPRLIVATGRRDIGCGGGNRMLKQAALFAVLILAPTFASADPPDSFPARSGHIVCMEYGALQERCGRRRDWRNTRLGRRDSRIAFLRDGQDESALHHNRIQRDSPRGPPRRRYVSSGQLGLSRADPESESGYCGWSQWQFRSEKTSAGTGSRGGRCSILDIARLLLRPGQ
jgi:hypothetical protein